MLGTTSLAPSTNDYDWLEQGIYFWENDPKRALEWADNLKKRHIIKRPAVGGAIIDLGNCLDLTTRDGAEFLEPAFEALKRDLENAGEALPRNEPIPRTRPQDEVKRNLDCAVIGALHTHMAQENEPPFEPVRAMFPEGESAYPNAGFQKLTPCADCSIRPQEHQGVFLPPKPGLTGTCFCGAAGATLAVIRCSCASFLCPILMMAL